MPKKTAPNLITLPHLALLIATLIWAAAGPIIRVTVQQVPPATFLFLRFLLVCTVLLPYAYIELKRFKVNPKDYFNFFLLGLCSQTSIILIFFALKLTTALDHAIIVVLGSLAAIYAGHHFYKDKIDKKFTLGLILASLGTIFVVLQPAISPTSSGIPAKDRILGNLLTMVYNLTWVTYIVWSKTSMGEKSPILKKTLKFLHLKPMSKSYSPSFIVIMSFYVGLATMIPIMGLETMGLFGNYNFNLFSISSASILGILYMAILSSIAAYMLYQWSLEHIHISDAAIYGYLSPIFTLPFAYLLLREIPNAYMVLGGAVIGIGVLIAEKRDT